MSYSRPSSYPYPASFKNVKDVEEYQKKLYASLMENDRAGEYYKDKATDIDLKQLIVRPEWYGAKGDGVTSDSAAFTAATAVGPIRLSPDKNYYLGTHVTLLHDLIGSGQGDCKITQATGTASYLYVQSDDITLANFRLVGTGASGGIQISLGADNITIRDVYFYQGQQRVWLYACSNIKVLNCVFDNTGYGVIQQLAYASDYVLVDGCYAYNMANDFIEANCASTAPSYHWIITNNQYASTETYATGGTGEERFAGITSVENVIISDNNICNAGGDGAIHLEDTKGYVLIHGNTLKDCKYSEGNNGWIYILNSAEDTIISDNTFLKEDANYTDGYGIDVTSGAYTNSVIISGNIFSSITQDRFSGIKTSSTNKHIKNNIFKNLAVGVTLKVATDSTLSGNTFLSCTLGIGQSAAEADNIACRDMIISDNFFDGGTTDLAFYANTNGSYSGCERVIIDSNRFDGAFTITAQTTTGTPSTLANDVSITNNHFTATATFTIPASVYMPRRFLDNNATEGTAVVADTRYDETFYNRVSSISNGSFSSNTTGWTATRSVLSSVAGGQSGNCLKIEHHTAGANATAHQVVTDMVPGVSYDVTAYVKEGTSADKSYQVVVYDADYSDVLLTTDGTATGDWVQYAGSFTNPAGNVSVIIYVIKNSTMAVLDETMYFDEVTLTANGPVAVADGYIQYSADITAGNAAPHFRTEAGDVVKIYAQSHIVDATTSHAVTDPGDAPADADALREDLVTNVIPSIETQLNNLGTKLNSILTALETSGQLKTS